jgi:drug/metabolite transporter (DMT)-like permease
MKKSDSDENPKTNSPFLIHAILISVQLCFSGYHIIGSVAFKKGADPLIFALYREILATCLMYGLTVYKGIPVVIEKQDWTRIIYIGFCSFVNVVGTVMALQYISAVQYAMMQPVIPVVATILSVFLKLENLTIIKSFGICCAVGGAILTEAWAKHSDQEGKNVILGTALVCAQVFCMANIIVFQKPLLNKYDSTVLTFAFYSLGTGFTILICICWATRFSGSDFYFNNSLLPWLALIYVTVFATFYAYNAYSWAGKQVPPAITTVYTTLQPVSTALLSFVILNDIITIPQVVGGLLVIIGLFVTVYGRYKETILYPENHKNEVVHTLLSTTDYDEETERKMISNSNSNRYS